MRCWRSKEPFFFFSLSQFNRAPLFETLWTIACQAPLSIGFCRQEYWSGLPCPSSGHLPDSGKNLYLRSTCFDRRALYHHYHLGSPSKEPGIGKIVLKAWPYQIWEISVRLMGFSGGTRGKEPAWQWRICKRQGFRPWVWKIPSWQPTPVFLHGESHGQRSLAGCSLQGFTESDTTEAT